MASAGRLSGGATDNEANARGMRKRFFSNDLPRSRCWRLILVVHGFGAAGTPFVFRASRRSTWRPRCWCSSCWWPVRPAAGLHRHRELCAHHVLRHRCHGMRLPARTGAPPGRRWAGGLALLLSLVLAGGIGLFSLRCGIFFAMITLAVASAFRRWPSQLSMIHRRRRRPDLQTARAAVAQL